MMCPYCRHGETGVIDSRASQQFVIRRRRKCLSCDRRFTTYEKIEETPLKVIKKDGSRITFDREKIKRGLEKACYKRPISDEDMEAIVSDIEASLYENFDREVPLTRDWRESDGVAPADRQSGVRPLRFGLPRVPGRERLPRGTGSTPARESQTVRQ